MIKSILMSDPYSKHNRKSAAATTDNSKSNSSRGSMDDTASSSSPLDQFLNSTVKRRTLIISANKSVHTQSTASVVSDDYDDDHDDNNDDEEERSQCSSITEAKFVSFAPHAVIHPILSRSDYTRSEKRSTWFQSSEFDDITQQCVKQVQKMMNGETFKDKKYCSRGLEGHTRLAAKVKQQNKQAVYAAVLDEQDSQWESNTSDDERIAKLYIDVSSSCHLWAHLIGLQDQRVAY